MIYVCDNFKIASQDTHNNNKFYIMIERFGKIL